MIVDRFTITAAEQDPWIDADPSGQWVRYSDYAAPEAQLAERAGGVNEDALRALAQAYDREDAAQRGEPDPWNLDDPGDIGDSDMWVSERLACAQVAAEAFLSALLPEDAAGLVERLRQYEGRQWETTSCYNGTRDEAASLIQSQAARIAELEAGLDTQKDHSHD